MTSVLAPQPPREKFVSPETLSSSRAEESAKTVRNQSSGSSANGDRWVSVESSKLQRSLGGRVPANRVLLTLNQLAVMSQNGIEIADAVESVALHCKDDRLADSLDRIHHAINSGQSFSAAVAQHGQYFPHTLPPLLAAAEASGGVPETLRRCCARMRDELQVRATIVGALIYPVILVSASFFVISALILGVLPQFNRVFISMGKPVPIYTQYLLDFGIVFRSYWMFIVPGVFGSLFATFWFRKHPIVQKPLARFLMHGPLIRNAYRPLQAGRNLRTMASMVAGGVPMLEAVRLSRQTASDPYWNELLLNMEHQLIDGLSASSAITDADFVPPETMQMMATGEKTGRIAEVLEDIGVFYEEEATRNIKRLVVALEPMIILGMGIIVAGIVMSVMLPMLDVSTMRS